MKNFKTPIMIFIGHSGAEMILSFFNFWSLGWFENSRKFLKKDFPIG